MGTSLLIQDHLLEVHSCWPGLWPQGDQVREAWTHQPVKGSSPLCREPTAPDEPSWPCHSWRILTASALSALLFEVSADKNNPLSFSIFSLFFPAPTTPASFSWALNKSFQLPLEWVTLWSLVMHMPLLAECLPVRTGAPLAPPLTHSDQEKKNMWATATDGSTHFVQISPHPPASGGKGLPSLALGLSHTPRAPSQTSDSTLPSEIVHIRGKQASGPSGCGSTFAEQ